MIVAYKFSTRIIRIEQVLHSFFCPIFRKNPCKTRSIRTIRVPAYQVVYQVVHQANGMTKGMTKGMTESITIANELFYKHKKLSIHCIQVKYVKISAVCISPKIF